jgi:hypothetical protein
MQAEMNVLFLFLFVSDDGEDYVRLYFVCDMRLTGLKSLQLFVEHVRYICPISTEIDLKFFQKDSSVSDFVKRMSVTLPIGPNYVSQPFTLG